MSLKIGKIVQLGYEPLRDCRSPDASRAWSLAKEPLPVAILRFERSDLLSGLRSRHFRAQIDRNFTIIAANPLRSVLYGIST